MKIIALFFTLILLSLGCKKDTKDFSYNFHEKKCDLKISYTVANDSEAIDFAPTLSGDTLNLNLNMLKLKNPLALEFSKPVYVKGFDFVFSNGKEEKVDGSKLEVCSFMNSDQGEPGDDLKFPIVGGDDSGVRINGNDTYFGLLKTSYFEFGLLSDEDSQTTGTKNDKKLILKSLKILISDETAFLPKVSLSEVKSKYIGNQNKWTFTDWSEKKVSDEKMRAEIEAMKSLMYYGLQGNSDADKCFHSFTSAESSASEWHSMLESWYDQTKK